MVVKSSTSGAASSALGNGESAVEDGFSFSLGGRAGARLGEEYAKDLSDS